MDIPSRVVSVCKDKFLELRLNGPAFIIYSKDMWHPQDNKANLIAEVVVNKSKSKLSEIKQCYFD